MIYVFTAKRISPDCPFKSNQRLTNNSILTLGCAAWLQGAMHTVESSFLRNFDHLTPWCDTHCRARLRSGMHSLELDSVVGCTPWSSTLRWDALAHHRVRLVFRFSCFGICNVFSKNFWSKKDFLNNLWLRLGIIFILISAGITEKTDTWVSYWLSGVTAEFLKTFDHLTPWCDAHCGAWLHGGMHIAELFKNLNILAKSKPNLKVLSLFFRGLDGFESWQKMEVKNLVTHYL